MQGRHGDILLLSVSRERPHKTRPTAKEILAVGETTGHAHVVTAPEIYLWNVKAQKYIQLPQGGILSHEEHGSVILAPGTYQVIQQQEWDLRAEWRKIID